MMNRREALIALPLTAAAVAGAQADSPGITVRMSEPPNHEPPFSEQKTFLTPTEQFYVRNHFPTPALDESNYTLEVTGHVERPQRLRLAEIKALPAVNAPLTMECAGNGRVFLSPATKGLQWQFGAVGTAEWTGVAFRSVLERAGVKPGAVEVILVGADRGTVADPPSAKDIPFDRSIPLEKALAPETILAWGMNGEPLKPNHGFPLRAVIGGWYGMAAIKWLTKIIVTDKPYQGFWQVFDYSRYERRDGGLATVVPLTAMEPKAQIARPAMGEIIAAGVPSTIRGMAWAGEHAVAKVEVSTDGGTNWQEAKLLGDAKPFCWRLWELPWQVPAGSGSARLLARCVDSQGRGQPEKRDPDRRTYSINHLIPVDVTIRPKRSEP